MTADGETVVLYELPNERHGAAAQHRRRDGRDRPGRWAFGAPQRLATMPRLSHASLAVAPDGHALVSLTDETSILAAERAPGQRFGAPKRVAALKDPVGARTRVALDAAGRAAIAWSGIAFGGVTAVTRAPSGAFATPVALAPAVRRLPVDVALVMDGGLSYEVPAGGWYFGGADIHAGLDAGGAWVSWESPQATGGFRYYAAALATLPFDGSPRTTQTVGGRTADAREVTRVTLTDGAPALMWLDDQARLRLATEGAQTATTPPPDVRVGRPLKTALTSRDKLRLPIRCSGPCELRGQLVGHSDADGVADPRTRRQRDARHRACSSFLAPRRPGRVRIKLMYGPPGGHRSRPVRSRSACRSNDRDRSACQGCTACGRSATATGSTSPGRPTRARSFFDVYGTKTRSRFELPVAQGRLANNTLRRRFTATLPATGVRYVTLIGWGTGPGRWSCPCSEPAAVA